MKTNILFIFLILALISSSGCQWSCENLGLFCPKTPTNNPEFNIVEDIQEAQNTIKQSSNIIEESSDNIKKEVNSINEETSEVKSKLPEESKSQINPHLDSIKESSNIIIEDTTKIDKANAELSGAQSLLENAGQKIVVTEGVLDKMTKERDQALEAKRKAEEARDSALHKAIRWIIVGSIVAASGLGVFGFMYGSKLSLTLAGTSVVIFSIAIFIETYFVVVVIFGGIVLLGLIVALVWNIIVQKKAFTQIVKTVEATKIGLSKDKKEELFGGEGETGIMDSIQDKITMDLVSREKSKMPLWNSMKKKDN